MSVVDFSSAKPQFINELYQRTIAQGKNLTVAKLVVRKGATTRAHRHKHEEVIIILKGKWKFQLAGGEVVLGANQVLNIYPGMEHSSEVLEDVVAIDVCTPTREDWISQEDRVLHTDGDQFLWAV